MKYEDAQRELVEAGYSTSVQFDPLRPVSLNYNGLGRRGRLKIQLDETVDRFQVEFLETVALW